METPRNSDNYDISIHAPREGCDYVIDSRQVLQSDFNPRTP